MDNEKKSRIDLINDRIEKLKRQRTSIIARDNEKERKNRTRRLIQIGAIAIKYLDCPNNIEPEDFEKVIKFFIRDVERKGYAVSESGFMKVYKDKLNRRLKELKAELQDVNSKLDITTKSPYGLYIMMLELDGAVEALEKESIESKRDNERNLNDKFYMRKFEIEGALKALEKDKKELENGCR